MPTSVAMSSAPIPHGVATHLSVNGLIAITWVGAALGTLFTVARIAIRIKYMHRLLADDYFMLLALAFLITNAVLQTLQAPHLYYMILQTTEPDIVHHGLLYTRFEFPIIVMSLPLSLIWGTRINLQQKIGLAVVFGFGFVIIGAAIVRAIEITGKAYSDQAALAIWTIIVGCLPPFRAVISKSPSVTQYRYGFSSGNSGVYPTSPRGKLRSTTTNWNEVSLPVQDHRQYHNLDYEMNAPQNVHIDDVQVAGHSKTRKENLRGRNLEINMVQEFSVVSSH
ncbi:hypothetical protein N7517_010574 [Penicillium concentricum]|uniref:Rhodopsin domain-containing protein n=1 Tax=Penicillium concentricum TaxID=293559 RepID=A0A9W9RAF8_9EURO|nr:uncharacterized protein N7517_010574 [Penicillium concentricum]KAJ5355965.1 hypothetical protein N7517_010574 [Penicillium concentricum]